MSDVTAPRIELAPWLRGATQAVALVCFFALLSKLLHTVAPALNPALLGFVLLLAALSIRALPVALVADGAKLIIAQSALFLIPPVVAVARQSALLEAHWIPFLVIVVGGTAVSAVTTAIGVELTSRVLAGKRS